MDSNAGAGPTTNSTEGSPLKWSRLVRGTSCVESTGSDVDPPSDPWRFFSDIKGKIAKSVEEKITEIKSRNQEEGSPSKKILSKDNSSHSESEELSESSLSKTCGIGSTTEGVEMSSEDESLSLHEKHQSNVKMEKNKKPKHRIRFQKTTKTGKPVAMEGTISITNLTKLYNISAENIEEAFPLPDIDSDCAVEALEDAEDIEQLKNDDEEIVLKSLGEKYDNIKLDAENVLNIEEIKGVDKEMVQNNKTKTVFAPVGFFDFRVVQKKKLFTFNRFYIMLSILPLIAILYYWVQKYSPFLGGILLGFLVASIYFYIITGRFLPISKKVKNKMIWEVPAIKEHVPIKKYEGWMNELPDNYNPLTYHICQTQSVYLRLQGNLLKIGNTTQTKVPKRAMWNQPEIKVNSLSFNRVYNLTGAKVTLLPEGLTRIRLWSKKYPICVTLSDQMVFEDDPLSDKSKDEVKEDSPPAVVKKTSAFTFRKKNISSLPTAQRFSQLKDQENYYLDAEISRSHTPSPDSEENISETNLPSPTTPKALENQQEEIDEDSLTDGWLHCSVDDSPMETKLILFGRTDREKEDWFRKLVQASRTSTEEITASQSSNDSLSALKETDYENYMNNIFKKILDKSNENPTDSVIKESQSGVAWTNALIGRVLFDCMCDDNFSSRVKERIQRKLHAIRLPYFIEELSVVELNLGTTPMVFNNPKNPEIDNRGLWVDIDMSYEGSAVLTLMTKLNLMKLKQPSVAKEKVEPEKTAMFHSDVDDSAESSSEDESSSFLPNVVSLVEEKQIQNAEKQPPSKKFMKMVDRITESKIFQAATENKYIKKAMEGVSNTDLRLKVEIRRVEGTLVINIPPPPSDRIWVGFRPVPELILSAHPIVGERNITLMHITGWIEKKLIQEFQKVLVIPNMEDLVIPVMMSKLP